MKTVIAAREDFFPPDGCPVTLRTIRGDAPCQHSGDLTDVRHTHDFAELIVIAGGAGSHWIDGEIYPVTAGDVFLIQDNTEHCFTERRNIEMYNIMFDELYLREHLRSLRGLAGFNAFFLFEPAYRKRHRFQSILHMSDEGMAPLKKSLHAMIAELAANRPGCDLVLLAKVLEIFVMISREYSRGGNPMTESLCNLGEVISRLEREYAQPWTLRRISKIAAMAPSTLLPMFRRATGCSPIEYLLRVRLARAAERLLKTDDTVSEIAEACGFPDSNYFSRQFRKHYNASPRAWRNG